MIKFKFLHRSVVAGINTFNWPRRDDIDICHTNNVFYGPIQLVGNGPFTVVELENIKKAFALLTKDH